MADKDSPQEVAAKFLEKLKDSPFIMIGLMDGHHSEPMNVKTDDDQPNTLFIFSGRDNRIAKGGEAMAQFVGKGHDFFACLAGTVSEETDRATFDKLWDNRVEAWFPNGKQDARLRREFGRAVGDGRVGVRPAQDVARRHDQTAGIQQPRGRRLGRLTRDLADALGGRSRPPRPSRRWRRSSPRRPVRSGRATSFR